MINLIKWYKNKINQEKLRNEEYEKYIIVDKKFTELSNTINSMLEVNVKIKILTGDSEKQLEENYNAFCKTLNFSEDNLLGCVSSLNEPIFNFDNGLSCIVSYKIYELKDESSLDMYLKTIKERDLILSQNPIFKCKLQYKF